MLSTETIPKNPLNSSKKNHGFGVIETKGTASKSIRGKGIGNESPTYRAAAATARPPMAIPPRRIENSPAAAATNPGGEKGGDSRTPRREQREGGGRLLCAWGSRAVGVWGPVRPGALGWVGLGRKHPDLPACCLGHHAVFNPVGR
jgi:hypothetical protein